MKKVIEIKKTKPVLPERKRVAAYCRVSMDTERLHHSLSAQISRYSELIQSNPEWEFAGIYADEGISGTKAGKRPEFMRMIADCDAGKIDIVLTKSISRFARNTVDLLETVRHLKDIGVEVRFEKENIRSLSDDGELMLTLLASFAQEESISISNNVKWGIRKRMQAGMPTASGHFQIYGYRWECDNLVIVPEEAAVVKRIFQNFLNGKSRLETEREFAAEGIMTRQGCFWKDSNIRKVLENITYTGNILFQKEFISDPINKHRRKNQGELPQYYVENTHEAIIDYDTWRYVQDEMERRRKLGALANKSLNVCCFTGKIKCPYCGFSYVHCTSHRKNKRIEDYWKCGNTKRKDGRCPTAGTILDKKLREACARALKLPEFDDKTFLEQVDHIEVPKRHEITIFMKDGRIIPEQCIPTGHQDCWTAEYRAETSKKRLEHPNAKGTTELSGRIKCAACGCNFRRCTQPASNPEKPKLHYWRCSNHSKGCITVGLREDVLKKQIAEVMGIPEYDPDAFREQIQVIYVKDKDLLEIHFKDGRIETTHYVPPEKTFTPRSEESREHMRQLMKERWTPEYKAQMSRKMKKIRSEKFWNSSGK